MHCHHKAIIGTDAQERLLKRMGADVSQPAPGCCGQAGSFGYKEHSYDVSMRIGEHDLLPAVRDASAHTILMADGFSCREQIEHGSGRPALHFAEVLQAAVRERQQASGGQRPADQRLSPPGEARPSAMGLALIAGAAVGGAFWLGRRTRQRLE